jgi:hypothetical protein
VQQLTTYPSTLALILDEDAQLASVLVEAPRTGKSDHLTASAGGNGQLIAGLRGEGGEIGVRKDPDVTVPSLPPSAR